MSSRKVGRMAESTFETWCSALGITANKSLNDEKGWDYIVQFPRQDDTQLDGPLDIKPPEFSCLIQVKGTDRQIRSWPIKVSNWDHLAKSPLPAFFLIFEFNNQLQPEICFLIHVDKSWVAKVLKRLRELPDEAEIHKRTMVVSWSHHEQLIESDGSTMRQAIEQHIGGDIWAYTKEKRQWLDTVGYEDGERYTISVRMQGETEEEIMKRLVDFAIGVDEKMPVVGLTQSETRFGITSLEEEKEFEYANMSMDRKPDGIVQLRLRDSNNEYSVILNDAAVYNPRSVFPFIGWEYVRVRIVTDVADIFVSLSDNKITINLKDSPLTTPCTIARLRLYSHILETMVVGTKDGFFVEKIDKEKGPMSLGRMIPGYSISQEIGKQYIALNNVAWIASRFDVDPDVLVKPEQLHSQFDKFQRIRTIYEQPSTIWFEIKGMQNDLPMGKETSIGTVIQDYVEIGDWGVVLYAAIKSCDLDTVEEEDEDTICIRGTNSSIIATEHRIIHKNERDEWNDEALIIQLEETMENNVDYIV